MIPTRPITAILYAAVAHASLAHGAVYAAFCNNADCTDCGTAVDIGNADCLDQPSSRKAMKISGFGNWSNNLITSPSPGCPCQSNCSHRIFVPGDCINIEGTNMKGQSYRFVNQDTCPPNNC